MYNNDPKYTDPPGAGLASLLASRGQGGDSMVVHMAPEEVSGLQQLALSMGAKESDLYNPLTGQPQFSFLKKILPQIIGAIIPSVPGVGQFAKTVGFGNEALGSALIVGGATGLIEGDLKKGLMAGLGAYSGASIAGGLKAAAGVGTPATEQAPGQVTTQAPPTLSGSNAAMRAAAGIDTSKIPTMESMRPGAPAVSPVRAADVVQTVTPRPTFTESLSTMGRGIKNIFTTPEGGSKFMEGLGGGYKSPIGQTLSRYATFAGATLPFTEEPKAFPTGGAGGDELFYIPGKYDPSNTSVFQVQGQYYRRTPQGMVPVNPWALAPKGRGFADGGAVAEDPKVAATRSYIEELNRRARNPYGGPATSGIGGGLNAFGPQYLPPATDGGSGVDTGAAKQPGVGDIVGGIAANYLINKGIGAGVGYLRDKFFPSIDQLEEVEVTGKRVAEPQTVQTQPAASSSVPYTTGTLAALNAPNPFTDISPLPATTTTVTPVSYEGEDIVIGEEPPAAQTFTDTTPATISGDVTNLGYDTDYNKYTQVGGDLSKLSSLMQARSGLESLGTLGGLSSTGFGAVMPTTLAEAANATTLSGGLAPSGSIASQYGGMKGALEAGASEAGLGTLKNTIIPGVATALGAYNTAKAIEAGKEGRAAFSAATTAASAAKLGAPLGPAGMLAAAAIAAIGASMVNTKEQGDVALRNYWKAVDEGRGLGSAPPEELANGFINFYRTNKNNFAGQEKYGRKGNEDFVYDMTQVVNKAVQDGTVSKDADAHEIYQKAVQPWLNSMGSGPQDEDARRIQDYMMTDMIYNFMQGKPISNAQVKGDKNYKIVSEKPVFAGSAPPIVGQMDQAREQALTRGVDGRALAEFLGSRGEGIPAAISPFAEESAINAYAPSPVTSVLPEQEPVGPTPLQAMAQPTAEAQRRLDEMFLNERRDGYRPAGSDAVSLGELTPVPEEPYYAPTFDEPTVAYEDPAYYQRVLARFEEDQRRAEEQAALEAEQAARYMPEPAYLDAYNPYAAALPYERMNRFAGGGAIGDDFNFGFAHGGMSEYKAGGKLLDGPGDGMSDSIPAVIRGKGVQRAALADGEFVIPADVVSHLGNGSTKAGAKKLYQMMAQVRKARTGKTRQAPAVKTDRLLPA